MTKIPSGSSTSCADIVPMNFYVMQRKRLSSEEATDAVNEYLPAAELSDLVDFRNVKPYEGEIDFEEKVMEIRSGLWKVTGRNSAADVIGLFLRLRSSYPLHCAPQCFGRSDSDVIDAIKNMFYAVHDCATSSFQEAIRLRKIKSMEDQEVLLRQFAATFYNAMVGDYEADTDHDCTSALEDGEIVDFVSDMDDLKESVWNAKTKADVRNYVRHYLNARQRYRNTTRASFFGKDVQETIDCLRNVLWGVHRVPILPHDLVVSGASLSSSSSRHNQRHRLRRRRCRRR